MLTMTPSFPLPNLRLAKRRNSGIALLLALAAVWFDTKDLVNLSLRPHCSRPHGSTHWRLVEIVYGSTLRLCLRQMTVIGCPIHVSSAGCVVTTGGNFLYVQYMFLPFKIKERSSPGFHSRSSLGSITQITNSCINSLLRSPCHVHDFLSLETDKY